ncbi:MAG TPA: putative 2-dehydropantoate 2-reductase [Pseudomonas sp.]|uniref:putative 2-dehydropantoate 2-reductase n=1 Tax=Pseudomonas sp. TaxID=306 RepID=UPI002EDA33F8
MTNDNSKPRIGIIGTGAIGGFYGLMLARAGYDVHFLLRSEFSAVSQHGLRLDSQVHGLLTLDNVQAYSSAADMPPCEWLLVGAKTTNNAELAPAIAQAAAPNAKVLLLQNGLEVEDELRPLLPDSLHLLGGLCFICVHRTGPGQIAHQAFGAVNLGYHSGPGYGNSLRQSILEHGANLFRAAGIESQAMDNLHQARWQKLVWNIPYNGLSVLLGTGTTALMADADSAELIHEVMNEVVEGAQACGYDLPAGYAERLFNVTRQMPDYLPSMYHDFIEKRPLELEAIYAKPLAAALAAGHDMPKIRALHHALSFIDRRNR